MESLIFRRALRALMPGAVRHWLRGRQVARGQRLPIYRADLLAMHMANAGDGPTRDYSASARARLAAYGAR
jgi:hypothetical protein